MSNESELGPVRAAAKMWQPERQLKRKTINIAEIFGPVLQGEGPTAGVPSIFIRVQNCNFLCGLHNGTGVGKTGPDGKEITWWCDSEPVWKNGGPWTYDQIIDFLKEVGEWERVMLGTTHIIFTGGEPTMPNNAWDFISLLDHMNQRWLDEEHENDTILNSYAPRYFHRMADPYSSDEFIEDTLNPYSKPVIDHSPSTYVEIETNGSIAGEHVDDLYQKGYVKQINCSAKLANSGMPFSMRVNKDALDQITSHPNHWWKFVVAEEEDWNEIMEDFAYLFSPHDDSIEEQLRAQAERARIVLMPAGSTQDELIETSQLAWDMAVKHNVRFTDRHQVRVWNMATGK